MVTTPRWGHACVIPDIQPAEFPQPLDVLMSLLFSLSLVRPSAKASEDRLAALMPVTIGFSLPSYGRFKSRFCYKQRFALAHPYNQTRFSKPGSQTTWHLAQIVLFCVATFMQTKSISIACLNNAWLISSSIAPSF